MSNMQQSMPQGGSDGQRTTSGSQPLGDQQLIGGTGQQQMGGGTGQQMGQQQMGGGTGQQQMAQQQMGAGYQSLLFPTATHLSEQVRVPIIQQLNQVLADATVLMTHAKFAHWNLKGQEFISLHELFDEVAEVLEGHIDLIAERITALGGQAMGTAGMAAANCTLPPMRSDAVSGYEYVDLVVERMAIHDSALFHAINVATEYGDLDTADMLNEISREVSQYLWFLEAHLQAEPISSIPIGGMQAQQQSLQAGAGATGQQTLGGQRSGGQVGGQQQPPSQ